MSDTSKSSYQGTDRLLFGIIMGVLAFWLFAQTTLNIAPQMAADLQIEQSLMNIAVSITALFSGIFIVVVGGLADRVGRVRMVMWGFVLSILGSLLVGFAPTGASGSTFLMFGRIAQGLSAAFIMSSSLALVKTYWEGAARQRAISLWSMGSWGGSGFAALFGGLMASNVGWRWIFIISAVVSLVGMLMVRGTPECKAEAKGSYKFDFKGLVTFLISMVALQIVATQGSKIGWTDPLTLGLAVVAVVFGVIFFLLETRSNAPFVNFKLFSNRIYTGATISNFLLNGIAGMIIVSMMLLQLGGGLTAQAAGMLTLGYAITIVAFIRVGEKLLQRFGSRKPMLWACLISGLSIALLLPTNLMLDQYRILAVISYILLGLGLAFYATPSTDAALSNLPDDQAAAGAGIYKMASSLGGSFGVAISAAIFTALSANDASVQWMQGVITFVGRQDNVAIREAALVALGFNLMLVLVAILSILLTIPAGKKATA
ncbi:DHA2 family multidrug resistance protein-like MFS transporter [Rhodobacter viridis]|uniref:DHA2 family multidrug resistance protein-like MFS transporter n=1 Tax=Rhodobacter viridis TaxID=1054202 RepID=A0A318U1W8_9RHOB|nr:MFS transporter [Rhodobacter viridis]PYF09258.1 DHA2 family multidrug resistance protein-like MFS transporter [Rhodobacter viridis]